MLMQYMDWYYDILRKKIDNISNIEIKNKLLLLLNDKSFILCTDNSSRIEYLYLLSTWEAELYWHEKIINNFLNDIDYYLKNNNLYIENSKKIKGTNIYLSEFDRNPYNWLETHPDHFKSWTKLWYWDKNGLYWLNIYSKAFAILKNIDRGIYDELNFIIKKIIPIWTEKDVHNSASYKEAIGHLYMWLTTWNSDGNYLVIQCLEALIHESSHNKLNLVNKFDKILLNNFDLKYYSPYRPDARHLWWVFLWVHAFVPTIYTLFKYYKENNILDDHFLEKLLVYNIKNNLGLKVLSKHAKFTYIGDEIIKEVHMVMNLTNLLIKDLNIDSNILWLAKEKVINHFKKVKKDYSYLEY